MGCYCEFLVKNLMLKVFNAFHILVFIDLKSHYQSVLFSYNSLLTIVNNEGRTFFPMSL
jgi:hypothetical protein